MRCRGGCSDEAVVMNCRGGCSAMQNAGEIIAVGWEKSARLEIVAVMQYWSLVAGRAAEFSAEDFGWQGVLPTEEVSMQWA